MTGRAIRIAALTVALTWCPSARAWVERTVRSDAATVDIDRSGVATVSHELLLAVRGGPLLDLVVEPIDGNAELLPNPTVLVAGSGSGAGLSIPLTGTVEGTRLTLHVERERGLRTGTYQFRFHYRTDLRAAGKVESEPEGVRVRWTGPAYGDGIDAARVVFRLDRAATPPRLLGAASSLGGTEAANITDDRHGVFLSTFRRSEDKDELEVVRPHVTRGETVPWSIVADPAAFDGLATPPLADSPLRRELTQPPEARKAPPPTPLWVFGLLTACVSALYAVLVFYKARWAAEICERFRATPRALLPIRAWQRAALSGIFVFGGIVGGYFEMPWVSVASGMVAFIAAVHLPPSPSAPLRGPGSWSPVDAAAAFARTPVVVSSGRVFDAGTFLGFVLFCSLIAAFAAAALFVGRSSPFQGVGVALAASLLFPLFCTGRENEHAEGTRALDALSWIFDSLVQSTHLTVEVIGRIPMGGREPEEIRLEIAPRRPVPGLVAIEVGFDAHEGRIGVLGLPFVVVRVQDGSEAAECLQKGLLWTRGRTQDERVVVLRPKLPTRALARDLARDLATRFTAPSAPNQVARSAPRSAGKGSSASKPGTTSSPVHAT